MTQAKQQTYTNCFEVRTSGERGDYMLAAKTPALMQQWVDVLLASLPDADHVGFLMKRGSHKNAGWRRRWFVLKGDRLLYFENQGDTRHKGIVDFSTGEPEISASYENATQFEIDLHLAAASKGGRPRTPYELKAESVAEMQTWVTLLSRVVAGCERRRCGTLGDGAEGPGQGQGQSITITDSGAEGWNVVDVDGCGAHDHDHQADIDGRRRAGTTVSEVLRFAESLAGEGTAVATSNDDGRRDGGDTFPDIRTVFGTKTPPGHGGPVPAEPVVLPEPVFPVSESTSIEFAKARERAYTNGMPPTIDNVSDGLRTIMQRRDTLNGISRTYSKLSPLVDRKQPVHDKSATSRLVNKQRSQGGVQPAPVRSSADDVGGFLARNPNLKSNTVVIPTPAVLRTLVLSPPDTAWGAAVARISLSGTVLLRSHTGAWHTAAGSDVQSRSAAAGATSAGDGGVSVFKLQGGLEAHYSIAASTWAVYASHPSPPSGLAVAAVAAATAQQAGLRPPSASDAGGASQPKHASKAKPHKTQVAQLQRVAEVIMNVYSDPQIRAAGAQAKLHVLDDSKNVAVGTLVRKEFCTAVAMVIGHRLLPARGKNPLWRLVLAVCKQPSASRSTPGRLAAYRVTGDLATSPDMMGDDSVRFRSFVCAALNHQFLDGWLADLYGNAALKCAMYQEGAFMRTCPGHTFDEMLLTLQPLAVLPFRLFMSFERRRRAQKAQAQVQTQGSPGARHGAATAATAVAAPQTRDPRRGTPRAAGAAGAAGSPTVVKAIHDNTEPTDADELAFGPGDLLTVIEEIDCNWLLCKHRSSGETGMVPKNYIRLHLAARRRTESAA